MGYRHSEYMNKVLDTVPSVAIFQLAEVTHTKSITSCTTIYSIALPHQYNFTFFYFIKVFWFVSFNFFFYLLNFVLFRFFFLYFFGRGGGLGLGVGGGRRYALFDHRGPRRGVGETFFWSWLQKKIFFFFFAYIKRFFVSFFL